jgi:hypothetical protein
MIFSRSHRSQFKTRNQQMGYKEELEHFVRVCRGTEEPLLRFEEIYNSTLATFKIGESLGKGIAIPL